MHILFIVRSPKVPGKMWEADFGVVDVFLPDEASAIRPAANSRYLQKKTHPKKTRKQPFDCFFRSTCLHLMGGWMRKYVLEVRAEFEQDSPNRKAEQLAKDIAHRILDVHDSESHGEQIIRENSFASPLFHRLYMNLVDKDNTLHTKVEKLREDYGPHRASFNLTPQVD